MNNLRNLYERNIEKLIAVRENFPGENLEGPLLMSLESYFRQPRKLIIIGQETNGWACDYKNIDNQLATYREFNLGEKYDYTPFRNITRKLERMMSIEPYSCAWSNLNRYDHNGKAPAGDI